MLKVWRRTQKFKRQMNIHYMPLGSYRRQIPVIVFNVLASLHDGVSRHAGTFEKRVPA